MNCPYLPESKSVTPEEKPDDDLTYKLKPPADLRSQFLLKMEAREKSRREAELQRRKEQRLRAIMEFEKPPPDKYRGHRVHAWVLVLPSNVVRNGAGGEVTNPFFIETSSGDAYDLTDARTNLLYLGIESIWNDQNYWVNMQRNPDEGWDQINWDLTVTELWEHLLPGEPWIMRGVEDDVVEEDVRLDRERHLDMPFSYVNEIYIDSSDFEQRYPHARKTILYKKAQVDLYSPYSRVDGLIQKVTTYDDYEYTEPIEVFDEYAHRSDNLIRSHQILNTGYVIDYYKRGRSDACKEHRYIAHDHNAVDSDRTLNFYGVVRLDGLSQIRMYPLRLTQHFVDREDLLYYRDVEFSPEKGDPMIEGIHFRNVQRIIEKYHRNESLPAHRDIAIREFAIAEDEIRLKFHYDEGRVTRAIRVYAKPEIGENLDIHTAIVQEYNPDPMAPPEKSLYLFYEFEKLFEEEDQCISKVRDTEKEVSSFIKAREIEYPNPNLIISSFDRNRIADTRKSIKEAMSISESSRDIIKNADYLAPYFARIGNPKHISKAQAYLLRDDCLNDFKQLQVSKANLILRKFEKLTEELNKMQTVLTQSEDLTREQEEQILTRSNEINFNLQLLEMKLNHHKDLAPVRYKILIDFLQQDERLAILYKR
ncbi:hypothetical protein KPH14_002186 [Odynerus spinipes]|uniref:Dynein regulatory complex subunit 7 n=1 Tax=Odynerus spinipes TaxID=1348599 RepID=A0AAD9RL01_9HYME|nr:hypothetical protein KPH14_002186 [Odynerus spinipes]